MTDTLNNVPLPVSTWVDLYAASGITVGNKILVQNIGYTNIQLYVGATSPSADAGFKILPVYQEATNITGDSGAWARPLAAEGLVNVAESA